MKSLFYLCCLIAAAAPFLQHRTPTLPPGQELAWSEHGDVLVREVSAPTRSLHSSFDCFRGCGYRMGPRRVEKDAAGRAWAVFTVWRGAQRWKVSEVFLSREGASWTDVSSWYWSAWFHRSGGPWRAITRVEPEGGG